MGHEEADPRRRTHSQVQLIGRSLGLGGGHSNGSKGLTGMPHGTRQ